jgi:hypothetical protein
VWVKSSKMWPNGCFLVMWMVVSFTWALPSSLTYRFTARDFMAGGCMPGNEIDNFWISFPQNTAGPTVNPKRIGDASFCPIRQDIISGIYKGHPDFEAHRDVFADGKLPKNLITKSNALAADPRYTL